MNQKSSIALTLIAFSITMIFAFPDVFATTSNEIVAVTVDLQTILLEPNQVIPLLDTKSVGNMSKLQISATLPCESNNTPKLKIIAGSLGNLTGVIDTSDDYKNLRGPFDSCYYEGSVSSTESLSVLNKVFLKNDGGSSVVTSLGTAVTITGMFEINIPFCGLGHVNNGNGTCTFEFTSGTLRDWSTASHISDCDTTTMSDGSTGTIFYKATSFSSICRVLSFEFDTSSIPDTATILDTQFRYDRLSGMFPNGRTCSYTPITNEPSTMINNQTNRLTMYNDILDGTPYVSGDTTCSDGDTNPTTEGLDQIIDLGTTADSDLQNMLSDDWFGFGGRFNSSVRDGSDHYVGFSSDSIELQVTYIP